MVKRTINGSTKRYIEQIAPRWRPTFFLTQIANVDEAYFLDCGITYEPVASTSTVPGLWHLEGEEVTALVDRSVQGPFTVTNGAITLSTAISAGGVAHVGLPYTSNLVDLPPSQETQSGSRNGRWTGINSVVLRLYASRGIKVGKADQVTINENRFVEIKERHLENWDDATIPYSGDTQPISIEDGWGLNGQIYLRQSYPLPVEILGIYRDVATGGP